jgi:Zn-dependent peptidase ImmA (M78 family)
MVIDEALSDLKARYGIGDRKPVPIEEVVNSEGGRVVRRFMTIDASLSYLKRGTGFRISVNSTHPTVRQRFSIGHELGHVVLERALIDRRDPSIQRACEVLPLTNPKDLEQTCNRFSARLLIPDEIVAWLADWGTLSLEGLRNAAEAWAVSLQALAWQVLEVAAGNGGIIALRRSRIAGDRGNASLRIDWAMFPKGPRLVLEPGFPVVTTPLLEEMLSSNDEKIFRNVEVPLPNFLSSRDIHALRAGGILLLLIRP